uniref:Uncharacterized protein n=1 Tax=uncultured Elusimicrobia bacterium TaxID=699876 RepID=A0A650EMQ0_9BACT|nr:hypothetical protein Elusimicrob1349_1920 [uncultured Elusimicrobia bacterium]
MARIVRTHANPPHVVGEIFEEESLTDQLGTDSLESLVKRYMAVGFVPPPPSGSDLVVDSSTTAKDVDSVFDDYGTEDVSRLDKVDQLDVLVTAQRLAGQEQNKPTGKPQEEPEQSSEPPIIDSSEEQE